MSTFCNKILFFSNKEIVLDDLLNNLEKYMMTMKNSQQSTEPWKIVTPLPPTTEIDIAPPPPPPQQRGGEKISEKEAANPFFLPFRQKDTLFWCLYIAHYGYNDYEIIERNYGLKELETKSKVAEFLKSNPTALKNTNYKITKVATQEILSDLLVNQKDTSIQCLLAIISCFRINIIMVDKTDRLLLEFLADTTETETPTFLIKRDASSKYHIKTDPISQQEIVDLKSTKICLENYQRPMKPASAYKVAELEIWAAKIGIDISQKKHKKNELYDLVYNAIRWDW